MLKHKKIILIILILIFFFLLLMVFSGQIMIIWDKINIRLYGEPINTEGIINNKYFGINNEGKDAKKTTQGINNALEYASNHNINYLKLDYGTYLIDGTGKYYEEKGIALKSNMTFDLNGSTIKQEPTSDIRYSVITIFEVENVKLINGIVEGDKDKHDYNSISSTHEWGYGIEFRGAKSVELSNLIIRNLTGDGILISEMEAQFSDYEEDNISERIYISNCDIYDNRRQGISIIDAEEVYIYNNEIHHIEGTNPQAAIDIEPNLKTETVNKVYIYNNKFYELGNVYAIKTEGGTYNVDIYDNEIYGGFLIASTEDKINIFNNKIKKGKVDITLTSYNSNRGYNLKKVHMGNNNIEGVSINIDSVENVLFENNGIIESDINIEDCDNMIFIDNNFNNNNSNQFIYTYTNQETNILNLYLHNNKGIDKYKIEIKEDNRLNIITDEGKINQYILNNFK